MPDRWSPDPKAPNNNLIWKQPYGSRSTPMLQEGRVYIINNADKGINEQERVMCFDVKTGKVLWEHRFNVWHTDIVSSRLGWTNLAGQQLTGNAYAHGTQGLLLCFNRNGKVVWSRSLTEEFGRITGYGGRIVSPVVCGNKVIVGMINSSWGDQARGGNRLVALDSKTGKVAWWAEVPGQMKGTYYSNPVDAEINREWLLITGAADGAVHAFQVHTGKRVWSYPFSAGVVNSSPVVTEKGLVYISHGEENTDNAERGRLVCLDATKVVDGKPKLVWEVKEGFKAGYTSPIIDEGKLYHCDDTGVLYCFDAATGKRLWRYRYGRLARGSPVLADGKIYVFEVNAKFHILKPEEKRCRPLHEQFFPDPSGMGFVETNGSPAVDEGRIFLTTRDEIFCIGKKDYRGPKLGRVGEPIGTTGGVVEGSMNPIRKSPKSR